MDQRDPPDTKQKTKKAKVKCKHVKQFSDYDPQSVFCIDLKERNF